MAVTRGQAVVIEAAMQEQVPEVRVLRPQPGDVIVVRVREHCTLQQMDGMVATVKRALPDNTVLVMDEDTELSVVRKDGV